MYQCTISCHLLTYFVICAQYQPTEIIIWTVSIVLLVLHYCSTAITVVVRQISNSVQVMVIGDFCLSHPSMNNTIFFLLSSLISRLQFFSSSKWLLLSITGYNLFLFQSTSDVPYSLYNMISTFSSCSLFFAGKQWS